MRGNDFEGDGNKGSKGDERRLHICSDRSSDNEDMERREGMKMKGRHKTGKTSDGTWARIVVKGVSWRREKERKEMGTQERQEMRPLIACLSQGQAMVLLYFTQARAVSGSFLD